MAVRAEHCAPCHLANIDSTLDYSLRIPTDNLACQICKLPDNAATMLLCDGCEAGYHMQCLDPPLTAVPPGKWVCPGCESRGVTAAALEDTDGETPQRRPRGRPPSGRASPADAEPDTIDDQQLTGRIIARQRKAPNGSNSMILGRVNYLGPAHKPYPFEITYPDGSSERLSQRQILKYIQPVGTTIPEPPPPNNHSSIRRGRSTSPQQPSAPRRSGRLVDKAPAAIATAMVAHGCNQPSVPLRLNYSSPAQVKSTMQILMPGSWTVGLCQHLYNITLTPRKAGGAAAFWNNN